MELLDLLGQLAGILGTSGIISTLVMRRIDKLERMLDKREGDRVEESVLRGEVLQTTARLSEANTEAIRAVTFDDVCDEALGEQRRAMDRLEKFLMKKSAEYLHAN